MKPKPKPGAPAKDGDDALDWWVMIVNLLANGLSTVLGYHGGNWIIKRFNNKDKIAS
jgi:hypothetical protein